MPCETPNDRASVQPVTTSSFATFAHNEARHDLKEATVRAGAYAVGGEGLDFLLRLVYIVAMARLLPPEYFGLLSMVTAITTIAERFKDLGLGAATIQSPRITEEQISTLFWLNTGMGALIGLMVAAMALPLSAFYRDQRLVGITVVLATAFVWSGASNQHDALLRRSMRFGQLAVLKLAATALSMVAAVVLAVEGYGYWALVAREVLRSVFFAVGAWTCCPWLPRMPSRSPGIRRMLTFGADITASNLVSIASSSLDQVLLGRVFGAHPLGLYRQGFQLAYAPMNQLTTPIRVVTESALSRLQDAADAYRRYFWNILTALALVTVPLGLFMAVLADEIVGVALGPKWADAAPVFRVLALASCLQPSVGVVDATMVTCGYSRRLFWLGLLASLVLVACLFAGLAFGPTGVAAAQLGAFLVVLVPKLVWGFKGTPVTVGLFVDALTKPVLASTIMAAGLILLRASGYLHGLPLLGVGAGAALVLYGGTWLAMPGGRARLGELLAAVRVTAGLTRSPAS